MSAAGLLVFARCAGFTFRAPAFSHPAVPRTLRAGIALVLALAIAPSVHRAPLDGVLLVVAVAFEFALGTAIGMSASLLYDAAYAGGRMLDDYVGVKAIAPNVALVAPSGFGRVWSLAFTTGYLLLGAYRPVLLGFADSFVRVRPGMVVEAHAWSTFALTMVRTIVVSAASVAGPAIAIAFVVQVTLAVLSRVIPRFSTFTLSFPLVFAAVLVVTAIALPVAVLRSAHPLLIVPGGR